MVFCDVFLCEWGASRLSQAIVIYFFGCILLSFCCEGGLTSIEQHKLVYSETGCVGRYCVRFESTGGLIKEEKKKKKGKRTKNGSLLGPVVYPFSFFTTRCCRGYCQPIAAAVVVVVAENDGYH